ncbi:MAG: hypothetical protein EBX41_03350 [Chitinophagia bacterium]|nr:hypothetical protein [Chitinophagia bacterium]
MGILAYIYGVNTATKPANKASQNTLNRDVGAGIVNFSLETAIKSELKVSVETTTAPAPLLDNKYASICSTIAQSAAVKCVQSYNMLFIQCAIGVPGIF